MELTAEAAQKLINQTLAELGDSPTPEELAAVSNRLLGMYETLRQYFKMNESVWRVQRRIAFETRSVYGQTDIG